MKNLFIASLMFIASIASVFVFAEAGSAVERSEQANLVIYRPADNSAVNYRIMVDGNYMGKLKPNSAIKLQLSAGDHVIRANDPKHTRLEVAIRGDRVIYIRNEIDRRSSRLSFTVGEPADDVVAKLAASNNVARIN